ncbi:hypothetical protein CH35J_010918 [Colletotrichum higginsianum]|uniref:Uncharacterized protein n=1 Tax=Colletotrichum higginsianum TaxID=80884 RepID=A0A4T0VID5_9PEZI|nr:hypothetical protein CH35J_010918 [Colletotrichum higginsianum]
MSRLLFWALLAPTIAIAEDSMSYIFYDNQEFLVNNSNLARISWTEVEAAFNHPAHVDVASYGGLDWTKPYPGSPVDGFQAHLRIANDVPWPASFASNETTEVTALTFSIPDSLMDHSKGLPKPMDPSWFICQHYFVSALPDPTEPVDHSCGFLSAECRADMETSLTGGWTKEDPDVPCSALILDPIPVSCQDTLGLVRGDVIAWNSDTFTDQAAAKLVAMDELNPWSWFIGTGGVEEGNSTAYYEASNRTYVIGTVFGYSTSVTDSNKQTPKLSLACLRPDPLWRYYRQVLCHVFDPAIRYQLGLCMCFGCRITKQLEREFQQLCSFSCEYGYGPPTACQCLEYSGTPKTTPDANWVDEGPLEGVAGDDFVNPGSFACKRDTWPGLTCRSC